MQRTCPFKSATCRPFLWVRFRTRLQLDSVAERPSKHAPVRQKSPATVRRYLAALSVFFGATRLIDNLELTLQEDTAMPSFDIVSKTEITEVDNALAGMRRRLAYWV